MNLQRELHLLLYSVLLFAGTQVDGDHSFPMTGYANSSNSMTHMKAGSNSSGSFFPVEIVVLTDSDDEITPQPPYYDLPASVTLICHAQNATELELVSYQWSSTSEAFFAYNSTSIFNRKRLLSSADAGIHTCSVTDVFGNTGQGSVEMRFDGAKLYVAESFNYTGILPANNSFIVHYPSSCPDCNVEFYCFSNSTLSGVGEVVFPDGSYRNVTTFDEHSVVERLAFSTIHVHLLNIYGFNRHLGIFTCELPDSNGNTIETSVGVYASLRGPPTIDTSLSGYTDQSRDNSTTAMAQFECYTTDSTPTTVIWKRNGEMINIDGDKYATMQVVTDRRNTHYRNILIVRDVFGVIGNFTYSCEIENTAGSTRHSISIDIPVKPTAKIIATPFSEHEGQVITLTCDGAADPPKLTSQLGRGSHINIEWVGPKGVGLTEQNNIILGVQRHSTSGAVRTLTINGTSYKHAGVYTCQVAMSSVLQESVAQYHIVLHKNVTVSDLEESLVDEGGQTDSLMCTWNGGQIPKMEWFFLGENVVVPLAHTNRSWDMALLLCMVRSNDQMQQRESFRVKATLINNVSIGSSSDFPTAGENFTLTCFVISDIPTVIQWIGPNSEDTNPNLSLHMMNGSLSISFLPLHTSHGGVYTCVSSIGTTPSEHVVQQQYSITVQIPSPMLTIITEPNSVTLFSNTQISLVCVVKVVEEVDIPIRVRTQWNAPSILFGNSRITMTDQESMSIPFIFKSILSFAPVFLSDSGLYTCIVNMVPGSDYDSTVSGGAWTTQELTLVISLTVRIQVSYNPPPDFTLPSPPYYRPASSVTLSCIAENGASPLQYHWSSNCSNCFASDSSSHRISTDILKSSDAGTHTCTVTDAEGNSGYATTEMNLIGAGVYVTHSQYISSAAVSNNTAIKLECQTCQLALYCYSNSSAASSSAVIRFPNGRDMSYVSSYYKTVRVQREYPSGIYLNYQSRRYYSATSGIYICKVPDSHGNVIQFSFGLYFGEVEGPSLYQSSYTDLTSDPSNDFLAKLECKSRNSIPTNVAWLRNDVEVDIHSDSFQAMQIVDSSYSHGSYVLNILLVKDVIAALGNHNYTCLVENRFGTDSEEILMNKQVSEIYSPSETFYGDKLSLTCHSIEAPTGYTLKVYIEWWGSNGMTIDGIDGIGMGTQESIGGYSSRDLVFDFLRPAMDGVYKCQTTLETANSNESIVEIKEYRLEVLGRVVITGNEVPLVAGISHNILCTWNGSDIARIAWYLLGLESITLASTSYSSELVLHLDPSTTGLNGTTFICKAITFQGDTYEESTTVELKAMSVDIQVTYKAPSDFHLPSPPYYQSASSLMLTCIIHGAADPVRYQWSSTSTESFAHMSTAHTLSQSKLTSVDAGLHTCTVTDADGSTVFERVQIVVIGGGIFVQRSRNIYSRSVTNNTALRLERTGYYSIDVYCYSNSTLSNVTIVLPTGEESYAVRRSSYVVQELSPSGLRFYSYYRYSYTPPRGIYTCRMLDSYGKLLEMSFGLYSSRIGMPTVSNPDYRDLIGMANITGLAMIMCNSSVFPSTSVIWKKDNITIREDNTAYQATQELQAVVRAHINSIGEVSRNIQVTKTVHPIVNVKASLEPVYKSQLTLSCEVSVPPKLHRHIVPYTMIMWSTPTHGGLTTGMQDEIYDDGTSLMQNLTFASLNESDNGMYVCRAIIQLPNSEKLISMEASYAIRVKAMIIAAQDIPLITGIPSDIVCTIKERHVTKMEWMFNVDEPLKVANGTNSVTLTLSPNMDLNGTNLTCVATTSSGVTFEDSITIVVKELTNDVAIEMFPETPVAGENFTLICNVISDRPTMLSWIISDGEPVNESGIIVSQTYVDEEKSTLVLSFGYLHTSHGGLYTCNSEMNVSLAGNVSSRGILLEVEIAPPAVNVFRETEGQVNLFSVQTLRCEVNIIEEVDIPITVDIEWIPPPSFRNESKVTVSNITGHGAAYYSLLTINEYTITDSGNYTCIASATPTANTSGVRYRSVHTAGVAHVGTVLNVSITVEYNPPSDFTLPSPPFYRPASSVTLTCVAHDAIGNANYQWISTKTNSFVQGRTEHSIMQKILTAFDSGIHTCTVTDELGNSGAGWTEMNLIGAGIYVQHSEYILNSAVPNNTAVRFTRNYCYNCRLSFYCFSNTTADNIQAALVYPNGNEFPTYTDYYGYLRVTRVNSSGLYAHTIDQERPEGIYTCEIADSNGNILNLSIGAYYNSFGPPYVYRTTYEDLTADVSSTALAIVHCRTSRYPPTSVVWQKNGVEIYVDGQNFEALQRVTNRWRSYYQNILIIKTVSGVIGHTIYTCVVGNLAGNSSGSINIAIIITLSLSVDIHMEVTTAGDYEDDAEYTLTCVGEIASSKPPENLHLEDYTRVDWLDSTGPLIRRENITISESHSHGTIFSTLSFHPSVSNAIDRLYTCSMTMDIPTTDITRNAITQYRLIMDVAYLQLKFDVVSCTELYEDQIPEKLENDIKESLALAINQECKCGFLTSMIDHGEFNCYSDKMIGYRARIVGGSDTQSSLRLIKILNDWKSTDGTFVYTRRLRRRVWVDKLCRLQIDSPTAANCDG